MASKHEYRFYCETDGWQTIIVGPFASAPNPVECPINAAHTVRADSLTMRVLADQDYQYERTEIMVTDGKKPFVEAKSSSYKLFRRFAFGGTDNISVTAIKILSRLKSGTDYAVRVTDTSGAVIAEVTGVSSSSIAEVDLGAIANLPAGPADLELQAKATGKAELYALRIEH